MKKRTIFVIIVMNLILISSVPQVFGGGVTCSPGVFDVRMKKLGETIELVLVVGNLHHDGRNLSVYLTTPYDFRPRYKPMPNQNDIVTFNVSRIYVDGNGAGEIKMRINVPEDVENYGRRWETWIAIESEKKPGEVIITKVFARMLVQTPDTVNIGGNIDTRVLMMIGAVGVVVIIFAAMAIKNKKKKDNSFINNDNREIRREIKKE